MMHVPEIGRALDALEPELRRFRDEQGRELLGVQRAPLPDPEKPAPVRFLPKWDNVLLAHFDRTRVLPGPYRKRVIKMNRDVAQTFLVDGFVAGTWRVDDGHVAIEPFAKLSRGRLRKVAEEQERLETFLAGRPSEVAAGADLLRRARRHTQWCLFAMSLVFAGIATRLRQPRDRAAILCLGCLVFLGTVALIVTFPVSFGV